MSVNGEIIPDFNYSGSKFSIKENQTSANSNSGDQDTIDLGVPIWHGQAEAFFDDYDSLYEAVAFMERRRGKKYSFVIGPVLSQRLVNTETNDFGIVMAGVDLGNSTISFSDINDWIPKAGQYISYRTPGNGYYLGRVQSVLSGGASSNLIVDNNWDSWVPLDETAFDYGIKFDTNGEFQASRLDVQSLIAQDDVVSLSFDAWVEGADASFAAEFWSSGGQQTNSFFRNSSSPFSFKWEGVSLAGFAPQLLQFYTQSATGSRLFISNIRLFKSPTVPDESATVKVYPDAVAPSTSSPSVRVVNAVMEARLDSFNFDNKQDRRTLSFKFSQVIR